MTAINHGPATRRFAWRPVRTTDRGLVWLRPVYRRRTYIHVVPGTFAPQFWTYTVTNPDRSR